MDPLANGGSVCSASSWLLYDQQMTIRTRQEWGELGEDDNAQVRIGVTVEPPSSHQARLIKAVGGDCSQRTGPYGTVATIFDGNYSARVDKESVPACIFESRFVPAAFSQQISMVVPANVTSGTRAGTIRAIARRIDLEVAQAVNARINGNTPLSAEFVARAGRCDGNYEWMVEP